MKLRRGHRPAFFSGGSPSEPTWSMISDGCGGLSPMGGPVEGLLRTSGYTRIHRHRYSPSTFYDGFSTCHRAQSRDVGPPTTSRLGNTATRSRAGSRCKVGSVGWPWSSPSGVSARRDSPTAREAEIIHLTAAIDLANVRSLACLTHGRAGENRGPRAISGGVAEAYRETCKCLSYRTPTPFGAGSRSPPRCLGNITGFVCTCRLAVPNPLDPTAS
jgi:hypothetical protein